MPAQWWDLSDQKQRVLELLSTVQALRGDQLARLTGSRYRTAMHHLEELAGRLGLLDAAEGLPAWGPGRGKVWYLSPRGLSLMAALRGRPVPALRSPKLAAHAARVTEFLTRALEECHRHPDPTSVEFRAEVELGPRLHCDALVWIGRGWREGARPPGRAPLDHLLRDGRPVARVELVVALEADRGTLSMAQLARKARLYGQYYREGLWDELIGAFPRPAVVTEDPARAARIRERWREALPEGLEWRVSCWPWLEEGVVRGRWLGPDGAAGPLWALPAGPGPGRL